MLKEDQYFLGSLVAYKIQLYVQRKIGGRIGRYRESIERFGVLQRALPLVKGAG